MSLTFVLSPTCLHNTPLYRLSLRPLVPKSAELLATVEFVSLVEINFKEPPCRLFDSSKLDSKKVIHRLLEQDIGKFIYLLPIDKLLHNYCLCKIFHGERR